MHKCSQTQTTSGGVPVFHHVSFLLRAGVHGQLHVRCTMDKQFMECQSVHVEDLHFDVLNLINVMT